MKTLTIKQLAVLVAITFFFASCKQDVITLQPPPTNTPTTPSKGNADFTTYVAIGNSLTAGYQAGALFNEGQNNSFPKILSAQFSLAQGTTLTFNQPDINSVNGYSSTVSGVELGRYILFAADGNPNDAVPTPANPGLPAPYNTAGPGFTDAAFYDRSGFNVATLNNFGAPGILLGQCLIAATGGPSSGNPYYNPYYARFASNPGTSTILGDAIARQPSFFTFDLGNNDILGYATTGGDGTIGLTKASDFQNYYAQAIGGLMTYTTAKGIVTTIPDVTSIPFFTYIKWNAIVFTSDDAATIAGVNSAYAAYNNGLDYAVGQGYITSAEAQKRKISFAVGANGIVIADSYLTDLTVAGLPSIRQASASDLITLSAGSILGTEDTPGDPTTTWGVSKALTNHYVLVSQELDSISTHTTAFNQAINAIASNSNYSSRIAVADVNAALKALVVNGAVISDGVTIMPTFVPPFGAFSEDGVHPNSRGYAYMANVIIDALNAKFGANVPKASLANYKGTGLPVTP